MPSTPHSRCHFRASAWPYNPDNIDMAAPHEPYLLLEGAEKYQCIAQTHGLPRDNH